MFVKLHRSHEDREFLLNLDHVLSICPTDYGCSLWIGDDEFYEANETLDEIVTLIKQAEKEG